MKIPFRAGLAAVAALGLSAAAHAQPVPAVPVAPAEPQVIKWPGGYVVVNGTDVVVRQSAPGRSTNVVTGAGNGVGNRIVVDGGAGGGVTIVRGSRIGVGNKIVVDPDDLFIDLDALLVPRAAPLAPMAPPKAVPADPVLPADPVVAPPVQVAPAPLPPPPPSYKGKANAFWSKKAFSDALDCNLYWCPTAKLWFRYQADDDAYRPVPTQPPAPVDEK